MSLSTLTNFNGYKNWHGYEIKPLAPLSNALGVSDEHAETTPHSIVNKIPQYYDLKMYAFFGGVGGGGLRNVLIPTHP